jgi:hypothetical protein
LVKRRSTDGVGKGCFDGGGNIGYRLDMFAFNDMQNLLLGKAELNFFAPIPQMKFSEHS